jgi:hypothetical protein
MLEFDVEKYSLIMRQYITMFIRKILLMISTGEISDFTIYVSFYHHANGVVMPDNIINHDSPITTIVLQNQFWDLTVDQKGFEVFLDFFGEKHDVYITFDSIVIFADPEQNFLIDLREYELDEDAVNNNNEDTDEFIEVDLSRNDQF